MQNLKFLDPAKAMANLQKMPADAKVIEMFQIFQHILTNLAFGNFFKGSSSCFPCLEKEDGAGSWKPAGELFLHVDILIF